MPHDDDRRRFREFLEGVTPIEQDRIVPERTRSTGPARVREPVSERRFEAVDFSEQPDSFHAGGLQRGVLRKFRRGEIRPAARLDLHGYRRDRAQRMLESFVDRAASRGDKCILVIHGKGSRSQTSEAVLRQMVRAALMRHPMVLAYCPAILRDGGDGATCVYLKNFRSCP